MLPWATRVFVLVFVLVFRALINSICLLILSISVCLSNFVCPLTYTYVFVRLFTCLPTYLFIYIQSPLILSKGSGHTWLMVQQTQEQRYPFLPVCAVFSCVQAMACLQMLRIFNARNFMLMLSIAHKNRKRICTES